MTAQAGGASLRASMRAGRRALSPSARTAADASILRLIRVLPAFRSARRVALFFAFDGEPDLSSLVRCGRRKEYFAPVIVGKDMHFGVIGPKSRLELNSFGIPEPESPELVDPRALDLVLTPLVAFDDSGNRIGVGAGYYDRCFRFLGQRTLWFKPKLAGVAYSLQRVDSINTNPWDIPLWSVVTELGIRHFRRS